MELLLNEMGFKNPRDEKHFKTKMQITSITLQLLDEIKQTLNVKVITND